MLYDPKWEQKIKADPMKLETLIGWLERQNPDTRYDYGCNGQCMLAQYFSQHFGLSVSMGSQTFYVNYGRRCGPDMYLPAGFNEIALTRPRTFGAALKHAREMAR